MAASRLVFNCLSSFISAQNFPEYLSIVFVVSYYLPEALRKYGKDASLLPIMDS